eukprot:1823807-Pleurochrysis_carterae.AAC.2
MLHSYPLHIPERLHDAISVKRFSSFHPSWFDSTQACDDCTPAVPIVPKLRRSYLTKVVLKPSVRQVGTAKNVATACNILSPDADVLEITAETHPVLDQISTAEIAKVALRCCPDRAKIMLR